MNTLKKYFTKECAKRTFRTFIQTACGYAVTNIALVCNGIDFTDGNTVLDVLIGLAISSDFAKMGKARN